MRQLHPIDEISNKGYDAQHVYMGRCQASTSQGTHETLQDAHPLTPPTTCIAYMDIHVYICRQAMIYMYVIKYMSSGYDSH